MEILHVVKSIRMTEKSMALASDLLKYTFEVDKRARAHEIGDSIEAAFNVKVVQVNTQNYKGKSKRNRGHKQAKTFKLGSFKKAIVTLQKGCKIDLI